jgi:hypothetical protein
VRDNFSGFSQRQVSQHDRGSRHAVREFLEESIIVVNVARLDEGLNPIDRFESRSELGYDCSYIQMIPTPTGRKIRFVTNRPLRFGEVYWDTRSTAYNLTAGEFDANDTDKSKSTGVLYPAAELAIDKQGELQMNLIGDPWMLVDVLDWKGTPGVN